MHRIKVMIVDDSAVVRQVLTASLASDPEINVIGSAADPLFALDKMSKMWPDVIVLDVEMPRMDGITFLRKLMVEHPTPVVICSTLTEKGAATTMQALAAGAAGIVAKPKVGLKNFLQDSADSLIGTVKAAARVNINRLIPRRQAVATSLSIPVPVAAKLTADAILSAANYAMAETTERVIAIGASTGGTQALERVLTALPRVCPGIVVVQHMPEKFTAAFAERLNSLCQIEVREAKSGDRVVPGLALIAQGGRHVLMKRSGAQYYVDVVDGPPVSRHKPSVDVLFRSVAKCAGRNALGIIMTGMGDDGAKGMKEMHDMGAPTLAQDEESCVVYGMPKEAVKLGGVDNSISLDDIAQEIITYGRRR